MISFWILYNSQFSSSSLALFMFTLFFWHSKNQIHSSKSRFKRM
ncbi:unnamed protein product [Arabidopsis halleri]